MCGFASRGNWWPAHTWCHQQLCVWIAGVGGGAAEQISWQRRGTPKSRPCMDSWVIAPKRIPVLELTSPSSKQDTAQIVTLGVCVSRCMFCFPPPQCKIVGGVSDPDLDQGHSKSDFIPSWPCHCPNPDFPLLMFGLVF